MIDIMTAIQSLRPKAECVIRGTEIEWHSTDITQPTDSEIQAEVTRLQAEYDKLPQFEMQFDDNRDGTTTWVDSINEIKERFPK